MAFLEALSAPDLGLLINGQDFAATTDMTEEITQNVTYNGGFGVDGPVLRQVRYADEGTVTFTAILLKSGVSGGLNSEKAIAAMRDFEVITRRGNSRTVYTDCNWTRLTVTSGLDQVTISADISIPGYQG